MLKQSSITLRAIAFVVIVCVCLIAIDSWLSWNARSVQLQEMSIATANLARAMAQQADDTIKEADTTLVGIVERVEYDGASPTALARLHRLLAMRTTELPQLNGLFVYDENGKWIADAQPTLLRNFNNADREYFVFHRTHADLGPHIGIPVISRSTGKWVIPISRRINHADGSFGGVAVATVNVDFLESFYDSLQIGQAGAAALISNSAIMMAHRPFSDRTIGQSMLNSPLFNAYISKGPVGTAFIKSAQDGVTRLNSYRPLEHYPLFVGVAFSKDEILAEWRRSTLWHSSGVIFLVVMVSLFGWRLIKQIELRTQAEAEVVHARDALENLNRTLERLAMQDGLTGLANRRQFDVTLGNEFSRAMRNASTLALIMIDVDCFKQYNDIYGHAAGDECLRTISRTIKDLTPRRPGDLAARYGGEEIAVLLPNTDVAGAVTVAEKIRTAIRNLEIEHLGNPAGFVTLSAGVDALAPVRGAAEPTKLIHAADKALYMAKAGGRNRVCTSSDAVPL
jgi:diguanylate cyclase (GGDEF)-like protein